MSSSAAPSVQCSLADFGQAACSPDKCMCVRVCACVRVCVRAGALGGRLDHTLANLNTLYCYPHLNITLWGDGNLVRLLRAGKSMIRPSRLEGPTCGLVPLARPAVASSRGLKWNLDNTHVSGAAVHTTYCIFSLWADCLSRHECSCCKVLSCLQSFVRNGAVTTPTPLPCGAGMVPCIVAADVLSWAAEHLQHHFIRHH